MAQVIDRTISKKVTEGAQAIIRGVIQERNISFQEARRARLREQINQLVSLNDKYGEDIIQATAERDAIQAEVAEISASIIEISPETDAEAVIKQMADVFIQSGLAIIPDFEEEEAESPALVPEKKVTRKRRSKKELEEASKASQDSSVEAVSATNIPDANPVSEKVEPPVSDTPVLSEAQAALVEQAITTIESSTTAIENSTTTAVERPVEAAVTLEDTFPLDVPETGSAVVSAEIPFDIPQAQPVTAPVEETSAPVETPSDDTVKEASSDADASRPEANIQRVRSPFNRRNIIQR